MFEHAQHYALFSERKEEIFELSATHSTVEAYEFVRRLDRTGKVDVSPHGKKQKAATAFLRDEFEKQDFAKPISLRASRIFGPGRRFRIAQILLQMKLSSRASRPGLTVGFFCIACNGLRTTQKISR